MRRIEYGDRNWLWPDGDESLLLVNDWVRDLGEILPYVKKRTVCVQAGGACGIWPYYLSECFDVVYTFEPQEDNYLCLVENVKDRDNVFCTQAALGADWGQGTMRLHDSENRNAGAWYVANGDQITIMPLDSMQLSDCGLIQLDVEGFEGEALRGAENTIRQYGPVIVVEEKSLPQKMRAAPARNWLESYGYREIHNVHRDVIFVC